MGCCLSAGKVTAPPVAAVQIPPPVEEESVKEVVVQSVSVSAPVSVPITAVSVADEPKAPDLEATLPPPSSLETPEISHNKSEICSVSHSFSTATTTATAASILEDDALSKPHRPPPPTSRRSRPDRVSRSPRERHSPQGNLRPRLARDSQPNPAHNRRNVNSGAPLRRNGLQDGGPRRRSPSPASARRSPMKKREGGAPEKKKEEAKVDVEVKKEEAKVDVEVKKEEKKEAVDVKKEDLSARDPEVSMECFIFL